MDELSERIDAFDDASERSLPDDVSDVIDRARAYLNAELTLQKARVSYAATGARTTAIGVVGAFVFGYFALMAMVFGLILALAPRLTAWGATAVVGGPLLILALAFAWLALGGWRRISGAVSGGLDR